MTIYSGKYITAGWRAIGSKEPKFDAHNYLYELEHALVRESMREAEIVKRSFEKTTATWEHEVIFKMEFESNSDGFGFTVYTEDKIYQYVNNGTAVRHAVLSHDFVPKTRVRTIGSGAGAGRVLYANKNIKKPGIVARHFVEEIADRRTPYYQKHMQEIFKHITEKYWRWAGV